jgi:arylsulfatase A-like enzyme
MSILSATTTSLTLLAVLMLGGGLFVSAQTRQPNIVFILADDVGYGDFGCYGQRQIQTPHIDRLARAGMRFTQAYAGSTVCAPSRSTLMTGLHTGHTPVRGNRNGPDGTPYPLPPTTLTVAQLLRQAGYDTAMTGRWHLGELGSQSMPHQMGFDLAFGALARADGVKGGYYREFLYRNGEPFALAGNRHGARQQYDQDLLAAEAINFINTRRDKPFFLYVPFSLAHEPLDVPDLGAYRDAAWPQHEKIFAAMVTRLDAYVGQIVGALDARGLANDTLVMLASDNGPHQEGGQDPHFFDSNGPLRGIKRDLYEGGLRIPFLARWPGRIKANSVNHHVLAFWDFLPTAAELAGVKPPKETDGISFLPTLLGQPQRRHDFLYWEFEERGTQAIRQGDWKAVRFIVPDKLELYDLKRDPGEQRDVAAQHPARVAEMRRLMRDAHTPAPAFPLLPEEGGPRQRGEKTFVRISPRDPRYFELTNGEPYIPLGLNLAFLRFITDEREGLAKYEEYFRKLAAHGGNLARIWLSHPFFQIETQQAGRYDEAQAKRLDAVIAAARRHGIRLKFCFEHFRTLDDLPVRFPGSVSFGNPLYHLSRGGPLNHINEFFSAAAGRKLYLDKLDFYAARYRDEPVIFGWELWNEINAVSGQGWMEWTAALLPELKRRFPHHLALQSLGSHDNDNARDYYRKVTQMRGNEVAQVHRYLDLGARLDVCRGPMDVLAVDALRELTQVARDKPALVSEVGAVEPKHAGPSKLYEADKDGVLLHDALFAPFFAGAAGPGQFWHWHEYVDKHDLWWHFGRFAQSVRGLDPRAEAFQPAQLAHPQLRIYALQGKNTWLAWVRDTRSDWQTELVARQAPATLQRVRVKLPNGVPANAEVNIYDPWKDRWVTQRAQSGYVVLPAFQRSLVIKIER